MLSHADCIAGQNVIGYDIPANQKVYPGWKVGGIVRDTRIESKLLYPDLKDRDFAAIRKGRLSPTFQAKGLIGTHKLESWGVRIGRQLKDDFNPKDYGHTWKTMPFTQAFDDYCMQDVRTNVDIFKHFESRPFFVPEVVALENRVAQIINEQCLNGVHFNSEAAEKLVAKLIPIRAGLEQECQTVFTPWYAPDGKYTKDEVSGLGGRGLFVPKRDNKKYDYTAGAPLTKIKSVVFNPGSRDQIADRLIKIYQWHPVELTDGGKPKVDETVLETLHYPEAAKLAEYFLINKRLGQIAEGKQAWLKKVKDTGKIHGGVDSLGAITNRMTHSNPNLAQVPANSAEYGEECRALFGPRPGWRQVGMDADGLEGRCLGHYLARYDGGKYIKIILEGKKSEGTDLHSSNRDAVGLNSRDNAKTIFYAWMYGAGDLKLGTIYVDDMDDDKRARFYAAYPAGKKRVTAIIRLGRKARASLVSGIDGMNELLEGVKAKSKTGWLRAVDGRRVRVRSQHAALNTLLQSCGAIVMKVALVLADKALREKYTLDQDFHYLLNIHDEIQVECRPEIAEEVGQILAEGVRLAGDYLDFRCPLVGNYDVGDNWSQTH